MKKTYNFILIVFLVILLFFLSGCSSNNENSNDNLKNKVIEELNYLDLSIIELLNGLNNISTQNYIISTKEVKLSESQSQSSGQSSGGGGEQGGSESSSGGGQSKGQGGAQSGSQSETTKINEMTENSTLASDKNPDWASLKNKIEALNTSWNSVIIDLYTLNIPSEQILKFSELLNKSIISIKNENKLDSLINLTELYKFIPQYEEASSKNKNSVNIKNTKYNVLRAYQLIEDNNWGEVEKQVNLAIDNYLPIMADLEYLKTNEYFVNKIYMLLMELKNCIVLKDKDVFFIKYKDFIEEINLL